MHEKIKRKCSFIAAMILTAVLFTGCAVQTNITFQENGSGSYEETISFAESTWEQMFSEDESDILNYYRTLYPQAEVSVSNETIRGTASKVLRLRMKIRMKYLVSWMNWSKCWNQMMNFHKKCMKKYKIWIFGCQ